MGVPLRAVHALTLFNGAYAARMVSHFRHDEPLNEWVGKICKHALHRKIEGIRLEKK